LSYDYGKICILQRNQSIDCMDERLKWVDEVKGMKGMKTKDMKTKEN
jgi:hypothetical protein